MTARRLLHVFPSFAVGGAQMRLAGIANHFGRRWEHAIIAMDGNIACRERLAPGLAVTFPALDLAKGDTLGNVRRIAGFLRRTRPDTLVTSNWGTIEWAMAARFTAVRHVHMEDGFGPEERERQLPRRVWTRRICLAGRDVVVPSRLLQRIATEIWKLAPDRVRYIPNGIDLARFTPHERPASAKPVTGVVAALRPEKNLGRLLRALAAVPEMDLAIVGDGPERAALSALAVDAGIAGRVRFLGHQTDPAPLYAGFDIFALSSDTEQMPLTVLEAMASGLPVAATDVGDIAAMLATENRPFVVPPDDTALAGALATLGRSPALRRGLGAANRARAEQEFAIDTMFAAYAALYDGA